MAGEEQGRPGSIHHINDIRWTQGGRWGGGGRARLTKTIHWIICSSTLPQFWIPDFKLVSLKLLVLISKKLAFELSSYIFEFQPLTPYVQPHQLT